MIGFHEVLYEDAIKSVYREFICKLCNIRVQEFLSTTRNLLMKRETHKKETKFIICF